MPHKKHIFAIIRWSTVLIWTIMVISILIFPSMKTVDHDLTLSSFISMFFSFSYGWWDVVEAIVHVILFAILTFVWFCVFLMHFSVRLSLLLAMSIATIAGVSTEIGQFFVNRDSMFLDFLANVAGIAVCATWVKWQLH